MKVLCENGNTVEWWYDRRTRESVCQVKDADENQIGEAARSGCRSSAKFEREKAILSNGGKTKKPRPKKPRPGTISPHQA